MGGRHLTKCLRASLIAALVWAIVPQAFADEPRKSAAEKQRLAQQLVDEALQREIYGAEEQRDELLKQAAAAAEGYEPARWHRGYVREHKRWVKFDELPQMKSDYRLLASYRVQREKAADTAAGQLKLAKWCKTRGLTDQARAHVTRVLELEPDHAQARQLLGHRRIGESWVTPEQIEASAQQAKQLKEAFAQWTPKFKTLLARLESPGKRTREVAAEELRSITDPSAIPVIEATLSRKSAKTASYAVDSLSTMSDPAAAVSLARHAVFSQWESVREDAAKRLKDKPMEHYVPVLLGAMETPVQARRELYRTPDGQLNYRYAVFREGRERNELTVFDASYVRVAREGGSAADSLRRAVVDAADRNLARDASIFQQNVATVQRNARIAKTLSESTGQKHSDDPSEWWAWWDEHNEVFVALEKPTEVRYARNVIEVEDFVPETSINVDDLNRSSEEEEERKDCLAAGTPVWTETGLVTIERVRIGDRVLAQDPKTGELAYKPVLRTTVRPASRLTRIHLPEGESISTSGGHLFWCSGKGWVRSRDVASGMMLHTVNGTRPVSFVEQS
ncbi:MAG: HEAT repeat domain-containing protein, partial [Pirellulales bacterium]|nr:HEAT repeat domain-containing protein [Pirellulales bacterium]